MNDDRLLPDDLVAIDVHTHVLVSRGGETSDDPALEALAEFFNTGPNLTIDEMAAAYRARRMAFVCFSVDASSRTGSLPAVSNDEIAAAALEHPDVLIPFASIDPHRGEEGLREAERLITEGRVRGFKFHPNEQSFHPNDPMAYPFYELLQAHGVPALFHSGQTAVGRGAPGGAGIRLKFSNPMSLDDVAVDFPDLDIVIAHPSFPWQEEAISVALHKPRVHIDLSGWSPKYFPPVLVQYLNTQLQDKCLFGSDFPALTPERWISDFDALALKPGVRDKVLLNNARRLLLGDV